MSDIFCPICPAQFLCPKRNIENSGEHEMRKRPLIILTTIVRSEQVISLSSIGRTLDS